jgi:hypothetical protein
LGVTVGRVAGEGREGLRQGEFDLAMLYRGSIVKGNLKAL